MSSIFITQMKNIFKFLETQLNVIIWTLFYITTTFLVLFLLFDFNILSLTNWQSLFDIKLKNFSGFIFGILLFSIVPLYIATIQIIIKTKKPLLQILNLKKEDEEKKTIEINTKLNESDEPEQEFGDHIPTELYGAFLLATKNRNYNQKNTITDNKKQKQDLNLSFPLPDNFDADEKEIIEINNNTNLVLPDSFDIENPDTDTNDTDAPRFKELNFDELNNESKHNTESMEIIKHLEKNNCKFELIEDDIVIYNNMAIITHSDTEFWITDEQHWFANGKQKTSPIESVLNISKQRKITPVIYLAEKNIMDIDTQINNWKSNGIKIIEKLEDLE